MGLRNGNGRRSLRFGVVALLALPLLLAACGGSKATDTPIPTKAAASAAVPATASAPTTAATGAPTASAASVPAATSAPIVAAGTTASSTTAAGSPSATGVAVVRTAA